MSRMANRQLAILRILASGRKITQQELAERTESCSKTIERDLVDLSADYDITVKRGRCGGVWLNPVSVVGRQYLTRSELAYIAESVANRTDGDSQTQASILKKINLARDKP